MSRNKKTVLTVVVVLIVGLAVAAWCVVSRPGTIEGYKLALQNSSDPADRAVLAEIENGPQNLAREKAIVTAAGIPITIHGMPPPPGEDAEPIYRRWQALALRRHVGLPMYAETLTPLTSYTPAQIAKVESYIAANQDLFRLMHEAEAKPDLYAGPNDPERGSPFPDLWGQTREAVRELTTESYLLARSGRYSEAVATQARGFNVARQVCYQPDFLSWSASCTLEEMTLNGLRSILIMAGPNEAVAEQVRKSVAANVPTSSLQRAIIGQVPETVRGFDMCRSQEAHPNVFPEIFADQAKDDKAQGPAWLALVSIPDEGRFFDHMIDAAEARDLSRMLNLAKAAGTLPSERRLAFTDLPSLPRSHSPQVARMHYYQDVLTLGFTGASPSTAKHADQLLADEQVTMAAAEVLEVNARSGSFPASLPGKFTDPFSGKQLGYRREGADGFVVYSVGPTGHFAGGQPGYLQSGWETSFRYPGPKPVPVPADLLR